MHLILLSMENVCELTDLSTKYSTYWHGPSYCQPGIRNWKIICSNALRAFQLVIIAALLLQICIPPSSGLAIRGEVLNIRRTLTLELWRVIPCLPLLEVDTYKIFSIIYLMRCPKRNLAWTDDNAPIFHTSIWTSDINVHLLIAMRYTIITHQRGWIWY